MSDSLLEALCGEIEIAWKDERNDRRVDQLAVAHPELSEELYDFLADLIEIELTEETEFGIRSEKRWTKG